MRPCHSALLLPYAPPAGPTVSTSPPSIKDVVSAATASVAGAFMEAPSMSATGSNAQPAAVAAGPAASGAQVVREQAGSTCEGARDRREAKGAGAALRPYYKRPSTLPNLSHDTPETSEVPPLPGAMGSYLADILRRQGVGYCFF